MQTAVAVPTPAVEGERLGLLRQENALLTTQNTQLDAELARLQGEYSKQLRATLDATQETAALAARLQSKEAECGDLASTCASPLALLPPLCSRRQGRFRAGAAACRLAALQDSTAALEGRVSEAAAAAAEATDASRDRATLSSTVSALQQQLAAESQASADAAATAAVHRTDAEAARATAAAAESAAAAAEARAAEMQEVVASLTTQVTEFRAKDADVYTRVREAMEAAEQVCHAGRSCPGRIRRACVWPCCD